ncbi:hypothetical protein VTK73DRAFT_7716 [Phialemonium thermophilum]|uniref:Uncharacterized protein n=1 Tax=Phialemonium thermophilum TaxID=223376 RepID=A0ABR3WD38_9PEZI
MAHGRVERRTEICATDSFMTGCSLRPLSPWELWRTVCLVTFHKKVPELWLANGIALAKTLQLPFWDGQRPVSKGKLQRGRRGTNMLVYVSDQVRIVSDQVRIVSGSYLANSLRDCPQVSGLGNHVGSLAMLQSVSDASALPR